MAGDEPSGGSPGAGRGPEDLFTPVNPPAPPPDAPQWPVERGPLPAAQVPTPPTGALRVPPPVVPKARRIGTARFAAAAAVLLVLLGAGTTATLLRSDAGSGDGSGDAAAPPTAPVTPVGAVATTSALPVTLTTGPGITTSTPAVTTSGPTTATSTRPPTATTAAVTSSRPPTSTTTTTTTTTTARTTTTTTTTPPTRSYSIAVAGAKEAVDGIAVAQGSRVVLRASGGVVVGYVQQDACKGTTSVGPGGRRTIVENGTTCAALSWPAESIVGSAPFGSLLARVGTGAWFAVGAGQTFTAQTGGTLSFRSNDLKPADNSGQFSVSYSVTAPA